MATDVIQTDTNHSSKVLVGGKVLLRMGKKIIGFANSATCDDQYSLEPIQVLGQLQPIEYVPTRATHRISLETTVLRTTSLYSSNIAPVSAGNYGYLNSSDALGNINFLSEDYPNPMGTNLENQYFLRVLHGFPITIEILSPDPSNIKDLTPVVSYQYCYYDSGDVTYASNRVTVSRAVFMALNRVATPVSGQTKATGGLYGPVN